MRPGLGESDYRWENLVGARKLLHFEFRRRSRVMEKLVERSDDTELIHDG